MDCDYVPEKKSKRQLKKEKRAMTEEQFLHKMNDEKAALGWRYAFQPKILFLDVTITVRFSNW